ncbi:hypothetical protein OS493_014596 [Desmophyllum pertusum]|uniref:Uncharacterized protein n=1 Tax=Desmophyllum pertusum TaxID=174260 RepID=A0A9W9YRA5_9CNID|nr:hypothetical protein OS493_014596 [Desmophyllum pertusum]
MKDHTQGPAAPSKNIPDRATVNSMYINVIPPSLASTEVEFTVEIIGEAFWAWRNLKTEPINYFEALNASLKPLGYKISDEISTKIGIRLGVETRYLSSRITNEKNPKKKKAIRGSFLRRISIQEQDMAQIPEQLIRERKQLKEQVSKLEQRLEEQADEVFQLLEAGIKQRSEIKKLEEATQGLKNPGKLITEVGERQRYRQLKTLREKTAATLWFAETYGLVPLSLQLQEKDTKEVHEVVLTSADNAPETPDETHERPATDTSDGEKHSSKYSRLPTEDKDNVKKLVYILDRFGVSIQTYHEKHSSCQRKDKNLRETAHDLPKLINSVLSIDVNIYSESDFYTPTRAFQKPYHLVYNAFGYLKAPAIAAESQLSSLLPGLLTSTPLAKPAKTTVRTETKVKVTVEYPSKPANKTLEPFYEAIGKALVHGPPERIASAVVKCEPVINIITWSIWICHQYLNG